MKQIDLEDYINETKQKEVKMKVNSTELLNKLTSLSKGLDTTMVGTGDSFIFYNQGIFVYTGDVIAHASYQNLGDFKIKGDILTKFLAKSPNTDFEVSVDMEGGILSLYDDNKKAEFSIEESDIDVSTLIPEIKSQAVGKDFIDALNFVMFTAIKHTDCTNHKILEYIHVGKDYVEATDATKLARVALTETKFENDFLIKADKLIKVKPNSIKEVGITDKFIFIQTDEGVLYALPTADSQFLDTDSVIAQTTSDNTVEVNFDDNLTSCLDRLYAVADGKTQPKITIKKAKAVCSYLNENVKFKETIRTDYEEDDDISFSFNPQTLKKALLNSKTYITVIPNSNSKIIKFISDNKLYILYMV